MATTFILDCMDFELLLRVFRIVHFSVPENKLIKKLFELKKFQNLRIGTFGTGPLVWLLIKKCVIQKGTIIAIVIQNKISQKIKTMKGNNTQCV